MVQANGADVATDDFREAVLRYLYAVEGFCAYWGDLYWEVFHVMWNLESKPTRDEANIACAGVLCLLLRAGTIIREHREGGTWYRLSANQWLKMLTS